MLKKDLVKENKRLQRENTEFKLKLDIIKALLAKHSVEPIPEDTQELP